MKVAVVGLGYFGVHYVRISRDLPEAELVAVCDVFKDRVDNMVAKHPELKGYTDIDELLEHKGLEAVILITHASSHYELAKKVLAAKKHLLIEKPLTTDAREAVHLTELAKTSRVTCLVGHTFLYNNGVRKTKQMLKSGGFGDLLYMHATRTNLGPVRDDVNAAWDLAPHDISIFQYLTDKVPSWVCAVGSTPLASEGNSPKEPQEEPMAPRRTMESQSHRAQQSNGKAEPQEDVVFITMGYEDTKMVSHIHVSWANPKKVRELTLVGTGMRVVFDDMDITAHVKVYRTPVQMGPTIPQPTSGNLGRLRGNSASGMEALMTNSKSLDGSLEAFISESLSVGDTYFPAVQHSEPLKEQVLEFLRCAADSRQPRSDARFGADVVRVLEAIQESVKAKGVRVPVASHESLLCDDIPLVDLKANYKRIKGEVAEAMMEVVENTQFVLGPQVKKFEDNFAHWCGTKHCIGVNSGTDALLLAMKFFGIGPGDEVITQANTFVATVVGISNCGAIPVLVDHDEFFMIDVSKIEAKITPKTKAILPVHLYGHMADMDAILGIAEKHNLKVIEDSSQAHGALYKGKRAGSMGDCSCFSFYPGQNLGAYGDGGAIVTNNDDLATQIQWWRSWGAKEQYHHEIKGGNSCLDTIQAVVLDCKLKYIDEWNGQRRELAKSYTAKLADVGDLVLPKTASETSPVWHLYVVRTMQRDALLNFLHEEGVGAGIHYPIPIHELGAYAEEMKEYAGQLPETSDNASKLLSLPMYPELTEAQVDRVVELCKQFFGSTARV